MINLKLKNLTFALIISVFALVALFGATAAYAQRAIDVTAKDIAYELPHPGILPDHPLYYFKKVRDSFWLFFTRDHMAKAELALLLADKRIVMAQNVAEKAKWEPALDTLEESESYYDRIIAAMEVSEKIGSSPTADFLDEVKLSSQKHYEIMEDMLKMAPQGNRSRIEKVMNENLEHYERLNKF